MRGPGRSSLLPRISEDGIEIFSSHLMYAIAGRGRKSSEIASVSKRKAIVSAPDPARHVAQCEEIRPRF